MTEQELADENSFLRGLVERLYQEADIWKEPDGWYTRDEQPSKMDLEPEHAAYLDFLWDQP